MVSLAAVARRAGVSVATVSRVINGITDKASAETAARVRLAIAELDYRPAGVGQALRRRQSRIVGVLAASLANPLMAAIASSIEWSLRSDGLVMALCDTHERADVQDEYLREMRSQLARAVVLIGAVESPGLDGLRASGATVLFVNRPDPCAPASSLTSPYVGIDNRGVGADVASALLAHGVRRFGLLHASLRHTAATGRRAGFLERLAAAGIPADAVVERTAPDLNHAEVGYRVMADYLAEADAPRVVVCLSDMLAYGAYRRLREAGWRVPEDYGLVGFDDNPFNVWIADWLNSAGVPAEHYGPAVTAMLKALWRGEAPPPTYLPHVVTVRRDRLPSSDHTVTPRVPR